MRIRPLQDNDYGEVREIDALNQRIYLGESWDTMSPDEQEQHLKIKQSEYPLDIDTGYSFVAESEDGRIAGFVLAFESMPFKGTVHIRHIGVHPNSQRASIGLQLYQQVIEQAKLNGIVEIRALINLDNAPSLRLHAKAGFALQERMEARLRIEGS